MQTVGLFEAKQKLSEIVERAAEGERIGITRRGKLAAMVVPAPSHADVRSIFNDIERIRKTARRPRGFRSRALIEEGRV